MGTVFSSSRLEEPGVGSVWTADHSVPSNASLLETWENSREQTGQQTGQGREAPVGRRGVKPNERYDPTRQLFERFDGTVGNLVLEGKLDDVLPKRTASAAAILMEQSDIPRGITSASHPYNIIYVNQAWCRLCGFSSEAVVGNSLSLVQGKATNKRPLTAMINRLLVGEVSCCAETINYKKDGTPFHAKITSVPLVAGTFAFAFKTEEQLERGQQLETDEEREVLHQLRARRTHIQEGVDEGEASRARRSVSFRAFVDVILIPTRVEVEEAWTKYYT